MRVEHLRTAIALMRYGTVNRTAAELGLAPSSVSDRVRRLESALGAALFRRDRDGMHPTPAGRAYLLAAAEGLDVLDEAAARLREPLTAVTVGAQVAICDAVLPDVLAVLERRWPGLTVTVKPDSDRSRLLDGLLRGELDAVLLLDTGPALGDLGYPVPDSDLTHADLRAVPMVAVAGPGHPLLGHPVRPADLRRDATLLGQESRCAFWLATRRWLGPGTQLTAVGGLAQVRDWVAAGRGVAVLPGFAVRDDLASGRLAALDMAPPPLQLRLVWRSSRGATEPVRTLLYALSQA